MADIFSELVSKCDGLIKAGQIREASALIAQVNIARVPRSARHPLAKTCRRIGLVEKGLRLLFPLVRNEKKLEAPATALEICEYANLLARNGSIEEAKTLLENIDSREMPEAFLYLGFCFVLQWDYESASGYFERFLDTNPDAYSQLIARVNLASSYLAEFRPESSIALLEITLEQARQMDAQRLIGNCLELRGQAQRILGNFEAAKTDLDRAMKVFSMAGSYDELLILKAKAIMESEENRDPTALLKFRELAARKGHWESVREADLYALKIGFDQKAYDRLVIGTGSLPYRARIQKILPGTPSPYFCLGETTAARRLNLANGDCQGVGEINSGGKVHQVLCALTRDFYCPPNMGNIFAELYPNEYFNVQTSPVRVRQILHRARTWLSEQDIPAVIANQDSNYKLVVRGDFSFDVPLHRAPVDSLALRWSQLSAHFSGRPSFTSREATSALGISSSGFLRLVEWGKDTKPLQISGTGKSTRYKIAS